MGDCLSKDPNCGGLFCCAEKRRDRVCSVHVRRHTAKEGETLTINVLLRWPVVPMSFLCSR